jgi:predicted dehydrogenase
MSIQAGLPVLVEKPLAVDLAGARQITAASELASVPVLTGHHRRHNPVVQSATRMIAEGRLGQLTAVQASTWFYKPDDYFETAWRTRPGAGPVYLNLIHDIDMLRCFCGEVIQVQAMESRTTRGHQVEDTAVVILRFENGALGTLSVSDCTVAPWSWELTSHENPDFPLSGELCFQIGGTRGSLALPDLTLWNYSDTRGWMQAINATRIPFAGAADPLVRQAEQFARVIEGREPPLVSARDGLLNQTIIEAIKRSASEQIAVNLDPQNL